MRRRAAFTMVELLVAIAIIALLVALLVPATNMALRSSRSLKCQSNLRQQGLAFAAYALEHNDALPPIKYAIGHHWFNVLAPYYGVRESAAGSGIATNAAVKEAKGVFWGCPRWSGTAVTMPGYGVNPRPLFPAMDHSNFADGNWGAPPRILRASAITFPSSRILLGDADDWLIFFEGNGTRLTAPAAANGASGFRHYADRANYLFHDLHVKAMTMSDAYRSIVDPAKLSGG